MAVTFKGDMKNIIQGFINELDDDLDKALDDGAEFMAKQLDLSFENQGMLDQNARGMGFETYLPTTIAAKKGRKNPPSGRELWAANSLEDTGKMRASLAIEEDSNKGEKIRYVGVGVPYIETHEEGGTVSVDGVSYDVPPRRFQYITDEEADKIMEIFEKAL
jgi:phage gpG-like protein